MSVLSSDSLFAVKIATTIGHICLQWARLEMALLGVIYALEDCPLEKGELIYGGLDMIPRVNMAIKLADYHKAPKPLRNALRDIRKELQNRLSDERNRAVHGVQKASDKNANRVTFTMVRFRDEKRDKDLTPEDLNQTAIDLLDLGDRAWLVFNQIGAWKFPGHGDEDKSRKLIERDPASGFIFAKDIYTRIKHLWCGAT